MKMQQRAEARQEFLDSFEAPRRQRQHYEGPAHYGYPGVDLDCPFCRRLNGITWDAELETYRPARGGDEVPDHATPDVEHWDETVAFRPLNPVTPFHTLVVPRLHVPDHTYGLALAETMMRAAELARGFEHMGWDTNIISSAGKAAQQPVRHLHVHVIPRAPGDGLMVPWGTTGDPNAPHDCHHGQRYRDLIREWRRQIKPLAVRAGDDPEQWRQVIEREATEAVDGRIAALEAQVRELGGVVPPRRPDPASGGA